MRIQTDLVVAGSGFGGSLVAMIARRLGLSVALLERGSHPRFAIGESSSPLANLLIESLSERYGLESVRPLAKWGSWQRTHPEIGCGLKRGFTFYGHGAGRGSGSDGEGRDQLLVAASPRDEIADTHWYRPDFDHFLMEQARASGALYFDRTRIHRVEPAAEGVRLDAVRDGEPIFLRARLLVDATGPRGLLARALEIPDAGFSRLPSTSALYTHFSGVRRMEELGADAESVRGLPPYPPDDAAVHHVLPGGWIWVLRFSNGITSAGVAATEDFSSRFRLGEGEPAWRRLLESFPAVEAQFAGARARLPFVHHARLSWRVQRAAGVSWTMLPSAAAFVDPLLSTGFPLTLLGIERLARRLEEDWGSPRFSDGLAIDAQRNLAEVDRAALLVASLYAAMGDFPLFAELTKLYFAAASFTEAARRLGRPQLAGWFLCGGHPTFGEALTECCDRVLDATADLRRDAGWRRTTIEAIRQAIDPIDVAGLGNRSRGGWFPVEASDLVSSAGKLEASAAEIERLLERTGFTTREPAGR